MVTIASYERHGHYDRDNRRTRAAMIKMPMVLGIDKMYPSLEGEGPFTGMPTFFVRTYGCNQNCVWCDTPQLTKPILYNVPDILIEGQQYPHIRRLSITGGEPTLQEGIWELAALWLLRGPQYTVNIETNGTVEVPIINARIHVSWDYKCAHAGLGSVNVLQPLILDRIKKRKSLNGIYKAVVQCREDIDEFCEWIRSMYGMHAWRIPLYVSPLFGAIELPRLAEIVRDYKGAQIRLSVQMHKIIWPNKADV